MIDDPATGSLRLTMTGTAKLAWNASNGRRWYSLDGSRVGQTLDIAREPGPNADAPFAVGYPAWREDRQTLILPQGGSGFIVDGGDVDTTAGPFRIVRTVKKDGAKMTMVASTRTLAAEIPFKDAPGVKTALAKLYERDVNAGAPGNLRATDADMVAMLAETPATAAALVDRAQIRIEHNDYTGGLADADAAVKQEPGLARAYGIRAMALAALHDPRAEAAAAKAAALDPKDTRPWYARAVIAGAAGRWDEADAALTRALEISPRDRFGLAFRAQTRARLGRHAEAIADADVLVAADPDDPAYMMVRVETLLASRPEEGFAAYGAFVKAHPDSAAAAAALLDARVAQQPADDGMLYARARMRVIAGDKPGGMADFATLIARSPAAGLLIERAQLWNPKDRARWSADLDAAAKLAPRDSAVWKARAVIEMRDGKFDAADAALTEAAQRAPADAQLADLRKDLAARRNPPPPATAKQFMTRAAKRLDDSDFTGALADADAAIRLAPGAAYAHSLRAFALANAGRVAEATAALDAFVAAHPDDDQALYQRARLRVRVGNRAGALADFDRILAIAPDAEAFVERAKLRDPKDKAAWQADTAAAAKLGLDQARLWRVRGEIELRANNYAEASAALNKSAETAPNDVELRDLRRALLIRQGRGAEVLAQMDAAAAPGASALNARCWTRATLNIQLDRALADCEAALRLNPGDANYLDSRALVHLRAGRFARAIADYDATLKIKPGLAESLFGRGLARAAMGGEGSADLSAARQIAPKIDEEFAGWGLTVPLAK